MESRSKILSTSAAGIGAASLALGVTALAVPYWAHYKQQRFIQRGHFGPWQTCIQYSIQKIDCRGRGGFQPSSWTLMAGVLELGAVICIVAYLIFNILSLLMMRTKERVFLKFSHAAITKFICAVLAAITSVLTTVVFILEGDDDIHNYTVEKGWAYYIQVVSAALTLLLSVMAFFEYRFSKRLGGDPTLTSRDPSGRFAVTFHNPAVGNGSSGVARNTLAVSVTDSSASPYVHQQEPISNGSVVGNGTLVNDHPMRLLRTQPLRSSLKKPKENNGGYPNPSFTSHSPKPSKRVRYNECSTTTEV